MIKLKHNDQTITLPKNVTLQETLETLGYATHGFAVAINQIFIPRTEYAQTHLQEGDSLEVVAPMQGG